MNKKIAFIFLLCTACSYRPAEPDDPKYAPVMPEQYANRTKMTGSLYTEENTVSLYNDVKARKVGDIITVMLDESNDASLQTNTKSSRSSSVVIPNPTILGSVPQFDLPKNSPLASNKNNNLSMNITNDTEFEGKGDSKQKNSLKGSIAVTVTQVWENGTLSVRGEKWMNLNQGKEFIRLTGLIRPEDVAANNTVSSTRVADARISYGGTGYVHDTNSPGWLIEGITSVIWPF